MCASKHRSKDAQWIWMDGKFDNKKIVSKGQSILSLVLIKWMNENSIIT